METILLLLITIVLGLSQKEGTNYFEIEQLDAMVTTKYKNTQPPPQPQPQQQSQQQSQQQPPQQRPVNTAPPQRPAPNGTVTNKPSGFGTPVSTMPSSPPRPANQKPNPPTNKTTTKMDDGDGFSISGFDFESVLSATIDETAFKELNKDR